MNESTNREKILKRIRQAHLDQLANPYPDFRENSDVFDDEHEDAALLFARRFIENKGKLIYCDDDLDFAEKLVTLCESLSANSLLCVEEQLQTFLLKIDFDHKRAWNNRSDISEVLVSCDALIARTGSIVFTYKNKKTRPLVAHGNTLLVYAHVNQIYHNFNETVAQLSSKNEGHFPDMVHCINGPSRNFEIECKEIIAGLAAEDVYLFLVNEDKE